MMDGIQAAPSYTWEDKGTLLQQTMHSPNIKEMDRALSLNQDMLIQKKSQNPTGPKSKKPKENQSWSEIARMNKVIEEFRPPPTLAGRALGCAHISNYGGRRRRRTRRTRRSSIMSRSRIGSPTRPLPIFRHPREEAPRSSSRYPWQQFPPQRVTQRPWERPHRW